MGRLCYVLRRTEPAPLAANGAMGPIPWVRCLSPYCHPRSHLKPTPTRLQLPFPPCHCVPLQTAGSTIYSTAAPKKGLMEPTDTLSKASLHLHPPPSSVLARSRVSS
jgi:hypothetical protein